MINSRQWMVMFLALVMIGDCLVAEVSQEDRKVMLKAVAVKPAPRQLAWQELEFTCFIHFGVNTFTGREWGSGKEGPKLFNPTALDTDQWCRVAKTAGMKMMLFTVKHHDGFCLWQTRYTKQSVESSPWQNGQGDVLRELSKSCKKYGLKLGVYLSPADLYQIENPKGLYGNLSKYTQRVIPRPVSGRPFKDKRSFNYRVDDYNEYVMNQLFELLTEYGPVHEVWFDGAHPKRKGGQEYTHDQWYELIRTLAPDAVIAIKGSDVRWCGNEAGHTRSSEWNVIPIGGKPSQWHWPDMNAGNLGSLDKLQNTLKRGGFLHWYPAETNTSIRHGWFWRNEKQQVKSTEKILDIWYRSVGGNTVFLLNVPPDREGRFADRDVKVLTEVGQTIRQTFKNNLATGAKATASSNRSADFEADKMLDGDTITCWMPPDWTMQADAVITLKKPQTFNRIVLQEQIRDYSQRIIKFAIDAQIDGKWQQITKATTVGYKRICRFDTVTTDKVRLRILESRVCPTVSHFGLYYESVRLSVPQFKRDKRGNVTIYCDPVGPVIRYTTDGSSPTAKSPRYDKPIPLPKGGVIKAKAFGNDNQSSELTSVEYDIAPINWNIHFVSSDQADAGEGAGNAIDGDPKTIWHSRWRPTKPKHPHEIAIDLGEPLTLKGFTYLPRSENHKAGCILSYEFYVSSDGKQWGKPVSKGAFQNMKNDPSLRRIMFSKATKVRYIKLKSISEIHGQHFASAAEIGVITR